MTEFIAQNELEQALVDGRKGHLPLPEFLKLLLRSPIYVLSGSEPQEDGSGFEPLIYPHPEESDQMICVFSSPARIGRFSQFGPYMMQVTCGEFLERLPDQAIGIVINPGDEFGFELRNAAIQSLVKAMKEKRTN
jgi:hypothetical protein